jgi:hypothetical protein
LLKEGKATGVADELDVGRAEFLNEGVDRANVIRVRMCEEDSADGCAEGPGGGEDVVGCAGEAGVDEVRPSDPRTR